MLVPDAAAPPLSLRLFGPFEARVNGCPLPPLRSRKGHWLLALLALRAGGDVERAWLAGMLWPDSLESQMLAGLRRSLTDLRQALGPEAARLRSSTVHTVSLDFSGADVDVVAFDQAIARGDPPSLECAVSLYRGPLLEGCAEEWAFQERSRREQAYLGALEALSAHALTGGDAGAAERDLRKVVGVDPLRESAQRGLIQALAVGGNYAAAIQTYRELRFLLHRELNAEPDPETQALFQQIRAEARRRALRAKDSPRRHGDTEQYTEESLENEPLPSRSLSVRPSPCLRVSVVSPSPPTARVEREDTLTFLFTDIVGSTRLWERHPEAMRSALARHDVLLRHVITTHGGSVFKTFGDQFCAAFATGPDAVAAALAAQRALHAEAWGEVGCLRVRMALHTGSAEERDDDYFGPPLNRVARLLDTAHGGQTLLSLATAELARDQLPEGTSLRDLGKRRLQDLVRPEHILQLVAPDLPADFPPLQSLEAFSHNLPVQLTSFIGRVTEMAEVQRLLAPHSHEAQIAPTARGYPASDVTPHLVTLTGAGGCGKTRLAVQVAADLIDTFPDGVWLVELAPISDPALVAQTAATVLDVREEPGMPLLTTMANALKAKSLLLLLDNCEHLVAACVQLAASLLQACPHLRVLATSREALGITGETRYRVPSLSVPDPRQLPSSDRLTQYEAVRLFIERAVAVQPTFTVTNENAPAVASVCHRLDGIPLAIELAAARVRVLSPEQIAARLDDRFHLLTGGSRTALPRQQTLRALIDWSYDLLSEQERTLLRRLSVFAGGFTLEAVDAVCSDGEVLDLLTQLVDKSLVLFEDHGGQERYRLLETVRQYSRDRLLESDEGEVLGRRHRDWYLGLAERTRPDPQGPVGQRAASWLDQMQTEHDNLRVALEGCQAGETDVEVGLRFAVATYGFWFVRGYFAEGRKYLEAMLARSSGPPTKLRANAFTRAAVLAWCQCDYAGYGTHCESALALFRELGDEGGMAWSLMHLGQMADGQGDPERARELNEKGLALARELNNKGLIALGLLHLGHVAIGQHEYERAVPLYEESLALYEEVGDTYHGACARLCLGIVALGQGDGERAREWLDEALIYFQERGDRQGIAWCLEVLAWVWREQGQLERAARVFGAAEALREAIDRPPAPPERAEHERQVAALRTALAEEALAAAWAEGRQITLEQAIAAALAETVDA